MAVQLGACFKAVESRTVTVGDFPKSTR